MIESQQNFKNLRLELLKLRNQLDEMINFCIEQEIDQFSEFWKTAERDSIEVSMWPEWKKQGFAAAQRGKNPNG